MKTVFYTFFNSKCDVDYIIDSNKFEKLIIFYCFDPPSNYYGNPILVNTNDHSCLNSKNDFVTSRLIKFLPWEYIENRFENYVYFDYRIKLSKKFISYATSLKSPHFFKHREGGILRDEIIRIISRNKSSISLVKNYLNINELNLNLPITENGVMVLTKDLEKSFKKMSTMFNKINRDQILSPIFLEKHKINFFPFTLSDLSYLHVRPKVLNFTNYLKLIYRELLFAFIWNR